MNFEDALRAMRDGEFVAREGALIHLFMRKSETLGRPKIFEKHIVGNGAVEHEWAPHGDAILANDWRLSSERFGFEEALRRLKTGKCVRRTGWPRIYATMNGKEFVLRNEATPSDVRSEGFVVTSLDLLAEDWVEYRVPGPF